jgi:cytochrome d ubiquinol oxidase subunit I
MASPAAFPQALHMLLAAYAATGLAVAGMHAWLLRRGAAPAFHRHALVIALWVGAPAALLQPLSGDLCARLVAVTQPVKLAALEGQFETERGAPLRIGGLPDAGARVTRWALEIPRGLSLLAHRDGDATVVGLDDFPRGDWPPVAVVHVSFQIMVASGLAMAAVSAWALWVAARRQSLPEERSLLLALALVSPLGFIAIEAGWIVTEVGRQPWIVQGFMRTEEAVTEAEGIWFAFAGVIVLYAALGTTAILVLRGLSRRWREQGEGAEGEVPYSPREAEAG